MLSKKLLTSRSLRQFSSYNNVPPGIWDLTQRKIYKMPNHPIKILIDKVQDFFINTQVSDIIIPGEKFKTFQDFDPLVTTDACFDKLSIPKEHASRSINDTFYIDETHCLRPHTSVH
jgi:phenylalanyl-tRNA synthetase alpha chain